MTENRERAAALFASQGKEREPCQASWALCRACPVRLKLAGNCEKNPDLRRKLGRVWLKKNK